MAHTSPRLAPEGADDAQSLRRRHRLEAAALFRTSDLPFASPMVKSPTSTPSSCRSSSSPPPTSPPPPPSQPPVGELLAQTWEDTPRHQSYFDAYPHRRNSLQHPRSSQSSRHESLISPSSSTSDRRQPSISATPRSLSDTARCPAQSDTPPPSRNAARPATANAVGMGKMVEQRYHEALHQLRARNPGLQGVITHGAITAASPSSSDASHPTSPASRLASSPPPPPPPPSSTHAGSRPPAQIHFPLLTTPRVSSNSHSLVGHGQSLSHPQRPHHPGALNKSYPRASAAPSVASRSRSRKSSGNVKPGNLSPRLQPNSRDPRSGSRDAPKSSGNSWASLSPHTMPNLLTSSPALSRHHIPPETAKRGQTSPWLDWYNYQSLNTCSASVPRRRANSTSLSEGPDTQLEKLYGMRPSGSRSAERRDQTDPSLEIMRYALTRMVRLAHGPFAGRLVSVADVGDKTGMPVFVFLGLGTVRYIMGLYDEFARLAGLRLICIDRWGVGRSDRPQGAVGAHRVRSWPSVIADVADQLGITSFSVLAHSAGAPFAMATALSCASRIVGPVHLLAPVVHTFAAKDYAFTRFVPEKFIRVVQAADSKVQQWRLGKSRDFDLDTVSVSLPPTDVIEANPSGTTFPSVSVSRPSPTQRILQISSPRKRFPSLPPGPTTHIHQTAPGSEYIPSAGLGLVVGERTQPRYSPSAKKAFPTTGGPSANTTGLKRAESMKNLPVHSRRSRSISSVGSTSVSSDSFESIQHGLPHPSAEIDFSAAAAMLPGDLATAVLKASNSESTEGTSEDLLCILGRAPTAVDMDISSAAATTSDDVALWGFSYKDVTRPVHVWQGDRDEKLSTAGIAWMVREMDDVQVNMIAGAGHDLMSNASVISDVLDSIAQLKPSWLTHTTT